MTNIFLGLICIFVAYKAYTTGILVIYYGYGIELGIYKIPLIFILCILGFYLILNFKKTTSK